MADTYRETEEWLAMKLKKQKKNLLVGVNNSN